MNSHDDHADEGDRGGNSGKDGNEHGCVAGLPRIPLKVTVPGVPG
jgi:hypothetical protein